ncbi:non-ribosomal peptide synthetase [Streptosporangium sp. NBC_01639]|uniref:non-ribosomal peptide synthetase n=1 Tax=Streptosporangium sp. NBC_01639 TaxID=2975948 RepID=UPI00386EA002|nr:non-ribosomal peptide synthetase [Streptosporangium sp. NBC_01639]
MVTTLELTRRWLELTPEAVAVSGTGSELTYRELHRRVDDLAAVLRERGVGPEVPVGLCMERTPGMVVAVLAVWAAGGAYVPLDPAFPEDRLRLMREDARIELVLTQPGVDRSLLHGVPHVLTLAQDGTVPPAGRAPAGRAPGQGDAAHGAGPGRVGAPGHGAGPGHRADHEAGPGHGTAPADAAPADGLAYLIYTSGSTGRPKGVAVPHRAVANLLASFGRRLRLTAEDSWLAVTTLSFDISVLELLLPLVSGARVVVASARETADGRALRELAVTEGITVIQATPATWRILLEAGGVPGTVGTRLCGGEALPRDLADALLGPGVNLWNVYGPTETTVWSTAGPVRPAPSAVDLGEAIDETSLHLLDESGVPVAPGEVGELHIGGTGVARGYHGMAAQTAARFLPDPFADRPGARMYATGDLARVTAEGRLEYLGRADQQVKIRGFRIELGEIETALRSAPEARHAAVGVCDGPDGLPRLVAYVVPAGPGDLWPALRERLRASLPEYMVPAHLVMVDALPLTPNGKLDRKALPPPEWTSGRTVPYRAPSTPVEDELTVMWAEVLGIGEPVGVDDDFFELGGHSLTAARIIARVQARFGAAVPIVALFEHPTVAGLALEMDRLDDDLDLAEVAALREQLDGLGAEELAAIFDELAPGA